MMRKYLVLGVIFITLGIIIYALTYIMPDLKMSMGWCKDAVFMDVPIKSKLTSCKAFLSDGTTTRWTLAKKLEEAEKMIKVNRDKQRTITRQELQIACNRTYGTVEERKKCLEGKWETSEWALRKICEDDLASGGSYAFCMSVFQDEGAKIIN